MARRRGAGRLIHRVTLQKGTWSGEVQTWSDAVGYLIPAFVRPKGSRDRVEAQAVENLSTHIVYMRFRDDVTPDRRLLWNDNGTERILHIAGVIDINSQREELEVECKEIVS